MNKKTYIKALLYLIIRRTNRKKSSPKVFCPAKTVIRPAGLVFSFICVIMLKSTEVGDGEKEKCGSISLVRAGNYCARQEKINQRLKFNREEFI